MSLQKKKCNEVEFGRIVKEYGSRILRFCEMYLGDHQLAEDVVQETFFKVYEKYGTYEAKASEVSWITRIAVNQCKNVKRKKYFHKEVLGYGLDPPMPVQDKDEDLGLVEVIKKLPEKEKEAILLYYYQEFEIKEIAACCNVMEATIRQRLKRGRDKLKDILERMGLDEPYKRTD